MSTEEEMPEKEKKKEREEQTEEQREIFTEIEEKLLAEGPYNDQTIVEAENMEISESSPPEEINEKPIDDQKEQNIEDYALRENQKEEIKKIEASLVTMAEEGFNDQQVIYEEEREESTSEHVTSQKEQLGEQIEENNEKVQGIEEIPLTPEKNRDQIQEEVETPNVLEVERRGEGLEELETVVSTQERFTDQQIVWEDETQKDRVVKLRIQDKSDKKDILFEKNRREANKEDERRSQSQIVQEARGLSREETKQKNIKQKSTHKEENDTRLSVIQSGQQATQTGTHSDLTILAREWNQYITNGGRITVDMWEIYNNIQEKYNKPIVLYKEDEEINTYRMSPSGKLFSQLDASLFNERLSNPSKQISKLLDYWLIQRGKKEGIKPFFEVTIENPNTKEMETYWIPNARQRVWNPYEGKDQRFFYGPRSAGRMITNFLTDKVRLSQSNFNVYLKLEENLRMKFPKLGIQTGNMSFNGQKILFNTFNRLKYSREVTEEVIQLLFWKYVDSHSKRYIQNSSLKISELVEYCKENEITGRKNITQMKIFVPKSNPVILNNTMENKLNNAMNKPSTSGRNNELTHKPKLQIVTKPKDTEAYISSRPIVKNLLTTLKIIEDNFGINGLSPAYKPPKNLILSYDNSNKNKLIINAESADDKDLAHFLLEGFQLSSRSKTAKGAFWFGKIMHPMKGKSKNEWHKFTSFLKSRSERKIENHDKWYSSKHAGGEKTVRRRINVEIDINGFKLLKAELMDNAVSLANDSSHRIWVKQTRADARRNKNPTDALKRAEENIQWWNSIRTLVPIGSENYQEQALLYLMNIKKSADESLGRTIISQKLTNIEFSKITQELEQISIREVKDVKTSKLMTLHEVIPVEESHRIGSMGYAFDVFNEHLGANIGFKAQLAFMNKFCPSQSPLAEYLGLDKIKLRGCEIELKWGDRKGYANTGLSMTDTFAPDVIIKDKSGNLLAVIQLKGYSQTRTSIQPNVSVIQLLELLKYRKNPAIKTALVNVDQIDDFIRYEWLVSAKYQTQQTDQVMERINLLKDGFSKHPEIDPLIPKNLRKRAFIEGIYEKAIDADSQYIFEKEMDNIKTQIHSSEENFNLFIGQKGKNTITDKVVENYIGGIQEKLQKLINQIGQPDGIESIGQFRYHWGKIVTLDYYRRIQKYFRIFPQQDKK
ncbi:hypothetical protein CEE45_13910 [Candidatus Heimdallarchaeota archaeon B3_Heim]|nr:MAG: hypothetical protein CEE45_13910 [Candidatus Heimdallarchaeota archaeon B3_Heim]